MARKPRDIPLNRRPPRDEDGFDWDPTRPLREQWPWNGQPRPVTDERITEAIADIGQDHDPPAGYEERVLDAIKASDDDPDGEQ